MHTQNRLSGVLVRSGLTSLLAVLSPLEWARRTIEFLLFGRTMEEGKVAEAASYFAKGFSLDPQRVEAHLLYTRAITSSSWPAARRCRGSGTKPCSPLSVGAGAQPDHAGLSRVLLSMDLTGGPSRGFSQEKSRKLGLRCLACMSRRLPRGGARPARSCKRSPNRYGTHRARAGHRERAIP
jgi:hypothetical protein